MKARLLVIVTAGLSGLVLLKPVMATAQTGSAIPAGTAPSPGANPTPLLRAYPPQPGFDPLKATNAELAAHGYPRRPTNPSALAAWTNVIAHAKHYVAPDPVYSSVRHVPPSRHAATSTGTGHSVQYSANWAGHIAPNYAFANATFTYSSAG